MGRLQIHTDSRSSSEIRVEVDFWPSEATWYYYGTYVNCGNGQSNWVFFGEANNQTGKIVRYTTFTGLDGNTRYAVSAQMKYADSSMPNYADGDAYDSVSILTYPDEVWGISVNQNDMELNISFTQPIGSSNESVSNWIDLINSDYEVKRSTKIDHTNYERSCSFNLNGLSSGNYSLVIYSNNAATVNDNQSTLIHVDTPVSIVTLLKWSWDHNTGSWNDKYASAMKDTTQKAYKAVYSNVAQDRKTTNFSHLVWNDLVDWLKYNLQMLDSSSSYSVDGIKMSNSDKVLTADRYNSFKSLQNKLSEKMGKGNVLTTTVSKGDPVDGEGIFITLTDGINNYINNM